MKEKRIIKIKVKINVTKEELKDFKPKSAKISIDGSTLNHVKSPNPSDDSEGTFWYELDNIDTSIKYSKVLITADGLKSPIKLASFKIDDQERKAEKLRKKEEIKLAKKEAKDKEEERRKAEREAKLDREAKEAAEELTHANEEEQELKEKEISEQIKGSDVPETATPIEVEEINDESIESEANSIVNELTEEQKTELTSEIEKLK